MPIAVTILWTLSSFMLFILSVLAYSITLTPRYSAAGMIMRWCAVGIIDLSVIGVGYFVDIYNDFIAMLGQPVILCVAVCFLYKEDLSDNIFIGLSLSAVRS